MADDLLGMQGSAGTKRDSVESRIGTHVAAQTQWPKHNGFFESQALQIGTLLARPQTTASARKCMP